MVLDSPPGSSRFEALRFDNEAADYAYDYRWLLGPLVFTLAGFFWYVIVDHRRPNDNLFWIILGCVIFWLGIFGWAYRDYRKATPRYVEIQSGGIEVSLPHWYEVHIPFDAILGIEERSSYSPAEFVRETFSAYGRVPVKGPHVLIRCSRRVRTGWRFWRRDFRIQLSEPKQFVDTARLQLAYWRTSHESGGSESG